MYGSVARREADEDSDIDILIVSQQKRAIYDQAARIRSEIDLKYETMTTLTYLAPKEIEDGLAGLCARSYGRAKRSMEKPDSGVIGEHFKLADRQTISASLS